MSERQRIFVGSSMEAEGLAERVGQAISDAGMDPVMWRTIFPAGEIILGGIERLANSVTGAVLLATPDLKCTRAYTKKRFSAPVANIIFEYGYLSARLGRERVAICSFDSAEIPSDLQGLTVIKAGSFSGEPGARLDEHVSPTLRQWLNGMVPLAQRVPPMRRLHGYSGVWDVQNEFSLWHGTPLGPKDRVTWEGKTLLSLNDDGDGGYGTQIGKLKVLLGDYRATWDVSSEIVRAGVEKDGLLTLRVEVRARTLVQGSETGTPPSEVVRESLPSPAWTLELRPVPGEPRKLQGAHIFNVAGHPYSTGTEYYTHAD